MSEWMGLIGVMVGGLIGVGGQWFATVDARRERRWDKLLYAVSEVVAQEEDFRNRAWEVREGLSATAIEDWDTITHRRAQAHLLLLAKSEQLRQAERSLTAAGEELGRAIRLQKDPEAVKRNWTAHRAALDNFQEAARSSFAEGRHSSSLPFAP